uniref:Uncharacterized protein n=1 Tax=Tanacetum cinerariifolium TaxID=118510 RepID=A0A6L2KWJ1_TANCI|nr:hypothetical protein [Tanacetum cinerariifolium]
MATNPNDVRLVVLMAPQEAHDEEDCLEEQMLNLMHRFAGRFTNRRTEIYRLMTLLDHPLIEYGRYTLGCMTGADMKKATYLKMVAVEFVVETSLDCHGYFDLRLRSRRKKLNALNRSIEFDNPVRGGSDGEHPHTIGRLIEGASCGGIHMVVKDLDLEPKIDTMMRDFLNSSWWKELSKETGSEILPTGDGSHGKTFEPIVSLIAKEKLKGKNATADKVATTSLVNCDVVNPQNLLQASSMSATLTSSQGILTSSLKHFDVVTGDCDAVSTHCMPYLHHLRVELQSCPVSSQIESKSRVFPLNAKITKRND